MERGVVYQPMRTGPKKSISSAFFQDVQQPDIN